MLSGPRRLEAREEARGIKPGMLDLSDATSTAFPHNSGID
jgi:hypothetical protein